MVHIHEADAAKRPHALALLGEHWGDPIISGENAYQLGDLPILIAGDFEGLATWSFRTRPACELVTLNAFTPRLGLGTALVAAVAERAKAAGCTTLKLTTTNDNVEALRFYQRRGFRLVRLLAGVVDEARRRKPSIPLLGEFGIPLRDELELELTL